MLKIYLSSTFADLEDYREKVYRGLRSLRHDVVSMEDYVAAPRRPLAKCLEDVRRADLYVGIFAWRYGYVPTAGNPDNKSITELELEEALRSQIPVLVFLLKDSALWSPTKMDANTGDGDNGARIKALRERLEESHLAGMFESADELASQVMAAVIRWQIESSTLQAPPAPEAPASSKAATRAAARDDGTLLWQVGARLRIRFLDGSEVLRQRVLRMARIWSAYANIGFERNDADDAEVRVSFTQPGSWAYEGTNALAVAPDQPTANFGWIDEGTPIDQFESVVVHEFGHVLGLAHEHQNPDANISWKMDTIYRELGGPPNNWSKKTVDNMFRPWKRDRYPIPKPFDPQSIMAFAFPGEFTEDGSSIDRNTTISAGDKEFVSRLYAYG